MQIIIRKAENKDVPRMLELIKELADFENELHEVDVTESALAEAGFGDVPKFTCFVADVDGIVQGMALIYFRFSTWKGSTVHLEDLIVTESYRGKGLGTKLYQQFLQFAKENHVKRAQWEVLSWNTPAIEFYQKTGAKILKDWRVVQMTDVQYESYLDS